jgi:uncharacterized membrane protein
MYSSAIRKITAGCIFGLLYCAVPVLAQDSHAFYISFQVPGSIAISAASINNRMTVAGTYRDANQATHGFVRELSGKITSFDPPGSIGTSANAINDEGIITGTYSDANKVTHGFLRSPWGTYTRIDIAGSTGTVPTSINAFGVIAGYYFTANGGQSFVRSPQGTITTFAETHAEAINLFGATVGFTPATLPITTQGFLRSPKGQITLFQAPGAASGGTYPNGIDAFGTIAGNYIDAQEVQLSFVRNPQGNFTTITPPNSFQTQVSAINEIGVITGFYNVVPEGMGGEHGFVRDWQGTITSFDVPGGGGTFPTSINDLGVIVGYSGASGFLRVP